MKRSRALLVVVAMALSGCAQVLPAPGPAEAERLWTAWRDNVEGLGTNDEAMVKITDELQLLRLTTLEILAGLH